MSQPPVFFSRHPLLGGCLSRLKSPPTHETDYPPPDANPELHGFGGGANGFQTLLKGDPEVVVARVTSLSHVETPQPDAVLCRTQDIDYHYFTINSDRKLAKYLPLFNSLRTNYTSIKFVNLSMNALGIIGTSSDSLLQMLQDLHLDANVQKNIVSKASNIAIRCSYYIYCRLNKQWTSPDLPIVVTLFSSKFC